VPDFPQRDFAGSWGHFDGVAHNQAQSAELRAIPGPSTSTRLSRDWPYGREVRLLNFEIIARST
jgi:hypothetical protein